MIRAVPKPAKAPKVKKPKVKKPKAKKPRSEKNNRALVIKKIDEYDSDICLISSNFTCLLCGKRADQNHHFFPKGSHGNVRFNPDNHCPLDYACHHKRIHQAGEVEELRDKLIQKIGEERFNILKDQAYERGEFSMPILRDLLLMKRRILVELCGMHPESLWGMSNAAMKRLETARRMIHEG